MRKWIIRFQQEPALVFVTQDHRHRSTLKFPSNTLGYILEYGTLQCLESLSCQYKQLVMKEASCHMGKAGLEYEGNKLVICLACILINI